MPFNTITVASVIAPTVLKTWCLHVFGGKPPKQKPANRLSYHEGLEIIRRFMYYASHHTVEEFQAFTARRVPSPHWVKQSNVVVPAEHLVSAGHLIIAELGPGGVDRVGGKTWWQWRGDDVALYAEWIEMKSDYAQRRNLGQRSKRIILYVHGGAYYFGSVDTHRYQLQRHARKLKARLFARPEEIIFAGDSSGGGMVASMLVILRDQKMPLPVGGILISPWLDLTHSFPSMNDIGTEDYLPKYGFMQRPSMAWPPPSADEIGVVSKCAGKILQAINSPPVVDSTTSVDERAIEQFFIREATATTQAGHLEPLPEHHAAIFQNGRGHPHPDHLLTVQMDGVMIELKDQIHMYTPNEMLSHPLVSPVLQPSLGGLPPLLVLTGGGEMLRDEQIYFAHKAANPAAYPPSEKYLNRHDPERKIIDKYKPTYVQLQVWENLCHVAPTLSFTQAAKYMYRSIAQFGAWALSRAQESSIEIPDWTTSSSGDIDYPGGQQRNLFQQQQGCRSVGKAGGPLPPFRHHMIRQLIDGHGNIRPLPDESYLPALGLSPDEIGEPKVGPVRRWLNAKQEWDNKYSRLRRKILKRRVEELLLGIEELAPGETPPPSSAAARRGISIRRIRKPTKKNRALAFWNSIANKHDEAVLRESGEYAGRFRAPLPRRASETRVVTDVGQSNESQRDVSEKVSSRKAPSLASSKYSDSSPRQNDDAGEVNGDTNDRKATDISIPPKTIDDLHPHPGYVPPRSPLRAASVKRRDSQQRRRPDDKASTKAIRHAQGVISPVSPVQASASSLEWETPRESLSAFSGRREPGKPRTKSNLAHEDDLPVNGGEVVDDTKRRRRHAVQTSDQNHSSRYNHDVGRPAPLAAARSGGSIHRSGQTQANFGAARGSSKYYYQGKELADEFNSTRARDPSETEPFPSFPASGNISAASRSRGEVNGDAEKTDDESGYSSVYSDERVGIGDTRTRF
ncbi:lipase/esterase [Coccidioides immitis RS]|uniref:Lipase/esterase n=1 Tax=Coccidioides immitis (strain RS) TaxID=246410 RepID=A0A0E1RYP1_COCIM|nr:lipase/esterase [Coccidioides immitis RS]EAS36023.1 lipase/esterase [Coccidioides immitis RS]